MEKIFTMAVYPRSETSVCFTRSLPPISLTIDIYTSLLRLETALCFTVSGVAINGITGKGAMPEAFDGGFSATLSADFFSSAGHMPSADLLRTSDKQLEQALSF